MVYFCWSNQSDFRLDVLYLTKNIKKKKKKSTTRMNLRKENIFALYSSYSESKYKPTKLEGTWIIQKVQSYWYSTQYQWSAPQYNGRNTELLAGNLIQTLLLTASVALLYFCRMSTSALIISTTDVPRHSFDTRHSFGTHFLEHKQSYCPLLTQRSFETKWSFESRHCNEEIRQLAGQCYSNGASN